MIRRIWQFVRYRHWIVGTVCFTTYIIAAIIGPNPDYRGPLSLPFRIVVLAMALSTFAFAVSLTFYFVDTFKRHDPLTNSIVYKLWMCFEAVLGVPFTLICYACAAVGLWVVAFK